MKTKTIECDVVVDEDRRTVLQLPAEVYPGQHRLVVTIDEEKLQPVSDPLKGLPTVRAGKWIEEIALSREDMYGEDGRNTGNHTHET